MINREQWAEIYDWARYNGLSPFSFITQAIDLRAVDLRDEEAIYEACKQYSLSRTEYPAA